MINSSTNSILSSLKKPQYYLNVILRYTHNTNSSNKEYVDQQRLLKVAIIGVPNAGKSTLINRIIQRNILATSNKVHTTRLKARAILVEKQTQIVFLDTPGLVDNEEITKYNLEKSFTSDCLGAIYEADTIGVLHDVSNRHTRNRLDPKVLRLLHLNDDKESFLILNKIDAFRSRRSLLDLSKSLTCNNLKNLENYKKDKSLNNLSEMKLSEKIKNCVGWDKFRDVFMISSLTGDGVQDIKDYLIQKSKPSSWIFPEGTLTDKQDTDLILEIIKANLLNNLPNEVPYKLQIELEYFEVSSDGNMHIVVLVGCDTERLEKLVIGKKGNRIRRVAKESEQNLRNVFFTDVFLKLVVTEKHKTIESVSAEM
ncbi:GTPase Era, mitochondrial-like [Daktulosphaira vitifoliae]|uniref:GTPase Era, mitochondrial-like n=1 Tax=Daktulosphaira vitifoliae TaxID=58002 RepID=UPI0021AA7484|nr:GTPase Era, mitochondrial-like [Daktulosphaira vitifoliae]